LPAGHLLPVVPLFGVVSDNSDNSEKWTGKYAPDCFGFTFMEILLRPLAGWSSIISLIVSVVLIGVDIFLGKTPSDFMMNLHCWAVVILMASSCGYFSALNISKETRQSWDTFLHFCFPKDAAADKIEQGRVLRQFLQPAEESPFTVEVILTQWLDAQPAKDRARTLETLTLPEDQLVRLLEASIEDDLLTGRQKLTAALQDIHQRVNPGYSNGFHPVNALGNINWEGAEYLDYWDGNPADEKRAYDLILQVLDPYYKDVSLEGLQEGKTFPQKYDCVPETVSSLRDLVPYCQVYRDETKNYMAALRKVRNEVLKARKTKDKGWAKIWEIDDPQEQARQVMEVFGYRSVDPRYASEDTWIRWVHPKVKALPGILRELKLEESILSYERKSLLARVQAFHRFATEFRRRYEGRRAGIPRGTQSPEASKPATVNRSSVPEVAISRLPVKLRRLLGTQNLSFDSWGDLAESYYALNPAGRSAVVAIAESAYRPGIIPWITSPTTTLLETIFHLELYEPDMKWDNEKLGRVWDMFQNLPFLRKPLQEWAWGQRDYRILDALERFLGQVEDKSTKALREMIEKARAAIAAKAEVVGRQVEEGLVPGVEVVAVSAPPAGDGSVQAPSDEPTAERRTAGNNTVVEGQKSLITAFVGMMGGWATACALGGAVMLAGATLQAIGVPILDPAMGVEVALASAAFWTLLFGTQIVLLARHGRLQGSTVVGLPGYVDPTLNSFSKVFVAFHERSAHENGAGMWLARRYGSAAADFLLAPWADTVALVVAVLAVAKVSRIFPRVIYPIAGFAAAIVAAGALGAHDAPAHLGGVPGHGLLANALPGWPLLAVIPLLGVVASNLDNSKKWPMDQAPYCRGFANKKIAYCAISSYLKTFGLALIFWGFMGTMSGYHLPFRFLLEASLSFGLVGGGLTYSSLRYQAYTHFGFWNTFLHYCFPRGESFDKIEHGRVLRKLLRAYEESPADVEAILRRWLAAQPPEDRARALETLTLPEEELITLLEAPEKEDLSRSLQELKETLAFIQQHVVPGFPDPGVVANQLAVINWEDTEYLDQWDGNYSDVQKAQQLLLQVLEPYYSDVTFEQLGKGKIGYRRAIGVSASIGGLALMVPTVRLIPERFGDYIPALKNVRTEVLFQRESARRICTGWNKIWDSEDPQEQAGEVLTAFGYKGSIDSTELDTDAWRQDWVPEKVRALPGLLRQFRQAKSELIRQEGSVPYQVQAFHRFATEFRARYEGRRAGIPRGTQSPEASRPATVNRSSVPEVVISWLPVKLRRLLGNQNLSFDSWGDLAQSYYALNPEGRLNVVAIAESAYRPGIIPWITSPTRALLETIFHLELYEPDMKWDNEKLGRVWEMFQNLPFLRKPLQEWAWGQRDYRILEALSQFLGQFEDKSTKALREMIEKARAAIAAKAEVVRYQAERGLVPGVKVAVSAPPAGDGAAQDSSGEPTAERRTTGDNTVVEGQKSLTTAFVGMMGGWATACALGGAVMLAGTTLQAIGVPILDPAMGMKVALTAAAFWTLLFGTQMVLLARHGRLQGSTVVGLPGYIDPTLNSFSKVFVAFHERSAHENGAGLWLARRFGPAMADFLLAPWADTAALVVAALAIAKVSRIFGTTANIYSTSTDFLRAA
jgi:hypothetical protein